MKVYVQGADGEEVELPVTKPDPFDGTYSVVFEGSKAWLRIVEDDYSALEHVLNIAGAAQQTANLGLRETTRQFAQALANIVQFCVEELKK